MPFDIYSDLEELRDMLNVYTDTFNMSFYICDLSGNILLQSDKKNCYFECLRTTSEGRKVVNSIFDQFDFYMESSVLSKNYKGNCIKNILLSSRPFVINNKIRGILLSGPILLGDISNKELLDLSVKTKIHIEHLRDSLKQLPVMNIDYFDKIQNMIIFSLDKSLKLIYSNNLGLESINHEVFVRKKDINIRNRIAEIFVLKQGKEIFKTILKVILNKFRSKYGFITYIDENDNVLCPAMSEELAPQYLTNEVFKPYCEDEFLKFWTLSLKANKAVAQNTRLILPYDRKTIDNLMSFVIKDDNKVLGQVTIANKVGGYNKDDIHIFESICIYISPLLKSYLIYNKNRNDLLKAKERAEQGDKMKTFFLQNISHEIRTPMNSIVGFTEILLQENLTLEERNQFTSMIYGSVKQLLFIVDSLVYLAEIYAGVSDISDTEINPNVFLETLREEYIYKELYVNNDELELIFNKLDNTNFILKTDYQKLNRILSILIDNALKFTSSGKIIVSCLRESRKIVFLVEDTGIGMTKDEQKIVFNSFVQANDRIRLQYGGLGVGLTIAKGLVEALHGNIELKSEKGKGSTFRVSIPII